MAAKARQLSEKDVKANLEEARKLRIKKAKLDIPSVSSLARVYQLAVGRGDMPSAQVAEQAVLSLGRAEAAIAESTVLASFLDEV